jgi:hypothetical protein
MGLASELSKALSGKLEDLITWYVHSGGVAGIDSVGGLRGHGGEEVVVTFDQGVQARTGIAMDRSESTPVIIIWNQDVDGSDTSMAKIGAPFTARRPRTDAPTADTGHPWHFGRPWSAMLR